MWRGIAAPRELTSAKPGLASGSDYEMGGTLFRMAFDWEDIPKAGDYASEER